MTKIKELTEPESCLNKAKDEELIFVLLERDPTMVPVILYWCDLRIAYGKNNKDDAQIKEAIGLATRILQRKSHEEANQNS